MSERAGIDHDFIVFAVNQKKEQEFLSRQEFEKKFPPPVGVNWNETRKEYLPLYASFERKAHLRKEMLTAWQAATALQDARVREMEEALEAIIHPIRHLQKEAEREGHKLDGMMAVVLAKDTEFLKSIARQALSATARNDAHDWKLQGSAGVWESYYKCSKCGATVQENTDGPNKPETGCATAREGL